MRALCGTRHCRQPQGAGGCDPPPAVLGSHTVGKGRALPNLLLPDRSSLWELVLPRRFWGACAGSHALHVPGASPPPGSAFAPWHSHLQLCPAFLQPGRARAGFGPVSLGVSLAPGLHWNGVLGSAQGMNGEAGAVWVLGILLVWRCPALARPHVFLRTYRDGALSYGVPSTR